MSLNLKALTLALGVVLLQLLVSSNGLSTTIGDKYYTIFTVERVNWYRAYQVCASGGMQLASMETESEQMALRKFLFENSLLTNNYWLSGNNLADKNQYVWTSSGKTLSYTKWAPSQPGSLANHCILTNSNFDWISNTCNCANYFICSMPLKANCGVTGQCKPNYVLEY